MTHRQLTSSQVWTFVSEGCNEAEIAAFAGVSIEAAQAMVNRALTLFARARAVRRAA